jgi:hypothetical protein
MTVKWGSGEVTVTRAIGDTGCLRETWRFTLERGQLVLRSYAREALPSRRHRAWYTEVMWGQSHHRYPDTMTAAQVPMTNALATEILQHVALSLEIRHGDRELPTLGYRLTGEDDGG